MAETRTPAAQGTLERYPLPRLIFYLAKKGLTGELVLDRPAGPAQIFFRQGLPVGTTLVNSEDYLGRMLLERGVIDEQTFNASLQQLAQGGTRHGQILLRMGAINPAQLLDGLRTQLRRKLVRLFALHDTAFTLYSGEHEWGYTEDGGEIVSDPLWLVYNGVCHAYDARRLMGELLKLQGLPLRVRADFARFKTRFGMGPEELALVEVLTRGAVPFERIFEISHLAPVQTQMLVFALWVTELLVQATESEVIADTPPVEDPQPMPAPAAPPRAPQVSAPAVSSLAGQFIKPTDTNVNKPLIVPPTGGGDGAWVIPVDGSEVQAAAPAPNASVRRPGIAAPASGRHERGQSEEAQRHRQLLKETFERIKDKNHFEVLELPRNASTEMVRDTFFKLAKLYHPDRLASLGLTDLLKEAEEIFRRINEANGVLSNTDTRAAYENELDNGPGANDEARNALEGEVAFQKGVVFFRKKSYRLALEHFKQAVRLSPKEGEHLAWVAWTLYADPKSERDKLLPKIKSQLLEAINLSPKNPTCHYFLGEVYMAMNDEKRALTCFNRVIELNPSHIDAARQIRIIRMRRERQTPEKPKGLLERLLKKP